MGAMMVEKYCVEYKYIHDGMGTSYFMCQANCVTHAVEQAQDAEQDTNITVIDVYKLVSVYNK